MIPIKRKLKLTITILLGIAVAGSSAFYFWFVQSQKETKTVLSLVNSVDLYDKIEFYNLKEIQIPVSAFTDEMVTEESELLGKVSNAPISAGTPLLKSHLQDQYCISDKEFVILKTDYARSGGVKTGDIVSIYKIDKTKGTWESGTPGKLVISEAKVISVTDSNGRNVREQKESTIPLGGNPTAKIQAVKIAVPKGASSQLVEAAVAEDNGYVLVVIDPTGKGSIFY